MTRAKDDVVSLTPELSADHRIDLALPVIRRRLTSRGCRPERRTSLATAGRDAGLPGACDLAVLVCA